MEQNIQKLTGAKGIIGVMGKEEKDKQGMEAIFETIITENFPKLISNTKPYIQEA